MSTNKKPSQGSKQQPRKKRDMLAFCRKLWDEMLECPSALEASRLRNKRLDELSSEELQRYFELASAGSNLNFDIGISS